MSEVIRCLRHPLGSPEAGAIATLLRAGFDTHEQAWDAAALAALVRDGAVILAASSGCAVIRVAADEAELLSVTVLPARRGAGLGAALLDAAHATAREAGAARMILEVAEGNAAARALYRRAGYAEIARRRGYYRHADGTREDALVMARTLAA